MEIKKITDVDFQTLVLESSGIVVVDFSSPHCNPCKAVYRTISELAAKYTNVVFYEMDTDSHPIAPSKQLVMALPTVIIYKNGKEEVRLTGAGGNRILEENLKKIMEGGER